MQDLRHNKDLKNPKDIQKIISGCCKRRPRYQRLFVDQYSDFLYAICCRYMGDRNLAKDELQNSLIKILDKIQSYDSKKSKIESWISTVTINTCLSSLRKRKVFISSLEDLPFESAWVDPIIIDEMNTNDILKLVESLPDIYREIFNLVEIDGYKHKEIANLLDIKESSSRARLNRSKEMLRSKILSAKKCESWTNLA